MVCLDTDFLIAYIKKDYKAIEKLESLLADGRTIAYTTTINAAELYKGVYRSKNASEEASKVRNTLQLLELLTLDHESARMLGELDSKIKSDTIGDLDLLIASIAITNDEILITKNLKHFERIPRLQVESW
jgi:tRNA(fMet)-specific endonuclease VapC